MEIERRKRHRFVQAPTGGVMQYPVNILPYYASMGPGMVYPFFTPSYSNLPGAGGPFNYSHNLTADPLVMHQSTAAHSLPVCGPQMQVGWSPLFNHSLFPQITPTSVQPILQYGGLAGLQCCHPVIMTDDSSNWWQNYLYDPKGIKPGKSHFHKPTPYDEVEDDRCDDDFEISAERVAAEDRIHAPNRIRSHLIQQQSSELLITELIFQSLLKILAECSASNKHMHSAVGSAERLLVGGKPTADTAAMETDDGRQSGKEVGLSNQMSTSEFVDNIMDEMSNEIILKMLVTILIS